MKTIVSLALGAAMLFGAATLGLRSGSASVHDNHWHHHHHYKHHRHHKHHGR